jgi:hypothetical protein
MSSKRHFKRGNDMRKTVTLKWLTGIACNAQVRNFERVFGKSVEITRANLIKAARTGQNPSWLAYQFLSIKKYRIFDELNKKNWRMYLADKITSKTYQLRSAKLLADILGLE